MSDFGSSMIVHPGAPAVECRVTEPDEPGKGYGRGDYGALAYAAYTLGYPDLWGETRLVREDSVMAYSAVFGCVRAIVNSFTSMGWHNYQRDGKSKVELADDVSWLLDMQANPEMNSLDWRAVTIKDALLRGNGYSEIERLGNGKPAWLWRLEPQRVEPVRDKARMLWYEVKNGPGEESTYLRPEDVFHLKGPSPDGLVGWDMIRLMKVAIDLGLKEERFGFDFFARGPMPGGFVNVPQNMNKEQRAEFRRNFEAVYSGSTNAHRIVVLSNGVTFDPASLPNDSAQFLESRVFQVNEICRFFGVPPHKLADLTRATFSNVEEQERAYVTDCILPWARRMEMEADVKLYGRTNRGRRFTRFNLDALMRGNSTTQTQTVTQKVAAGLMMPNEGREYFDMNPVEGGDVLIVQGAMTTLDRVVNPPEPPEPPAPTMQQQNGKAQTNGKAPEPATASARSIPLNFDEDQERDESGRWTSGGGGGEGDGSGKGADKGGDKAKSDHAAREQRRDKEDEQRQEHYDKEDDRIQQDRDKEEERIHEGRSKEDRETESKQDNHLVQLEKAREAEEAKLEKERQAEDERIEKERDRQDRERDAIREKEDDKTDRERQNEQERIDVARENQDNSRADRHEEEDKGRSPAERQAAQVERGKEEKQIERDRSREDREREKRIEKEDAQKQAEREKEDAAKDADRSRQDKESQAERDRQDRERGKEQIKQDKELLRRWEKEGKEREQERQKADREREQRHAREDKETERRRQEQEKEVERRREKEDELAGVE